MNERIKRLRELSLEAKPSLSAERSAASDEKRALDECDERWRANLARYQPPQWPEGTMAALQDVLHRAEQELL